MVKIVECNEEILREIPNVMELLMNIYGVEKQIALFATLVNDELTFVARAGADCVYIHKNGYNNFTLDENENLGALQIGDYRVFFGGSVFYEDKKHIEQYLELVELDEEDELGYDGYVSYRQYNPENDTFCEIRYQHMFNSRDGKSSIYGYHTQKIDSVHIDEQFSKKGRPSKGILPKTSKYYSKVEFDNEEIGYKWIAIKDYGLIEFLEKGPYQLINERNVVRYAKTTMINSEGNYADLWPLSSHIKTEDLVKLLESYGFNTTVPWELLDIHNGKNLLVDTVEEIVKELKVASKEAKELKDSAKCAILTLHMDK